MAFLDRKMVGHYLESCFKIIETSPLIVLCVPLSCLFGRGRGVICVHLRLSADTFGFKTTS